MSSNAMTVGKKGGAKVATHWLRKLSQRLLLGFTGLLAIAALVLSIATQEAMRDLPDDLAELGQLTKRTKLLDRHGEALTITFQNTWNVHDQRPLHEIPDTLQRAFILAEDKRFYQHSGIDWLARVNAVLQNVMALQGVRGASTISEQVIRMLHTRPRSMWARWVEGWEARELEQRMDKASILEFYLNQVPYAAQRRGVQQAARYYFDRDLQTLSEKEMLSLAVLVRAPSLFDLHKSQERIQGRLNILIDRAASAGLIANAERVKTASLDVQRPRPLVKASHFARYVYQLESEQSEQVTSTASVRTTLDAGLQHFANNLLNDQLAKLANKNVDNAGMIVLDHHTNEVLVWAIGDNANGVGTEFDTVLNPRQPGSTLKPFVYARAMEKGWTAATMIDDSPLQESVGRGVHHYRNYSNAHYGAVSLRNALGNSLNIPAIKAAKFVGLSPLLSTLNQIGITELDLRSVDYGNGIALGNGEVSLYSMARAYSVLANRGQYRPLKVRADSALAKSKTVFSKEISSLIGHILSDGDARALEFGRGGVLNLPVQTAVKTGTSSDYRDAWVFGFNHRYLVGVWMGNVDSRPMDNVTGSRGPALVMRSMFAQLNQLGDTKPLYLSPSLVERSVCIETGSFSDGQCASRQDYFLPNANLAHLDGKVLRAPDDSPELPDILRPQIQSQEAQPQKKQPPYYLVTPLDQTQMAYDPRIPTELQQLEFRLNSAAGAKRVEWYVNNELIAVNQSASQLWPIKRGSYQLTAKVFNNDGHAPPQVLTVNYSVK